MSSTEPRDTARASRPRTVYRAGPLWRRALHRIRQSRSVILGYHGVADCPLSADLFLLQVSPPRFRAQLEMMTEAGFEFVTVAELVRRAGGREPPPGMAAVSFDDGLRNNLTVALPILSRLAIPATVYVPSGWLGGSNPYIKSGGDGAILTADEVHVLARAGWEIGAHTVTHADLSALSYDDCRREIADCCHALEAITGARVETLAYPFGHYNETAIAACRDAGLIAAVTTGSGVWDTYALTRAMIGAADPFAVTLLKLTDRYEPLLSNAPMRFVRSRSKQVRAKLTGAHHRRSDQSTSG